MAVGSFSRGPPLAVVPMTGDTMTSEPGFSPAVDAKFKGTGNDYMRGDAERRHMRLDGHGVLETLNGGLIYLKYTGLIEFSSALANVISGNTVGNSTPFGNSFTHLTFETGNEEYKDLETGVFVATGRLIVEEKKSIVAENKVSRVTHG